MQTPVDAFVLAQLEASGMTPSRQADKRTLIRRASFDLTGLPPTPEEVDAFLADKSPGAFAKVVDRLLAAPQYGERWARHWLDVARYADTKGYVGGNEETRFPYSYTYRDYVIRAFNEDLPYDQFIVQQIAADELPLGDDNRPIAALGFLTLGRRFVNNENDIIDDRIDVSTRGTMGLTVTCARCHDHKYDPIPTQDYYSLFGVFKSCSEPVEKPLLDKQPRAAAYTNYLAELKKARDELDHYVTSNETAVVTLLHTQVGGYLLVRHDAKALTDVKRDELVRGRKLNMAVYNRWNESLTNWVTTHHPIFAPWFAFDSLTTNEFASKAKELAAKFSKNQIPTNSLNPLVAKMFSGEPPADLQQVSERYGKLFVAVDKHWLETLTNYDKLPGGQTKPPPPTALADAHEEALRQILYATNAPANPPHEKFGDLFLFDDGIKNKIQVLKKDVAAVDVTHPGAPPRAMVLKDNDKPVNAKVFIRGNPGTPGPEVPRRFLQIVAGDNRRPFPTNASGRLQLAQAIADRKNPLTARVFVNRIWLEHFGAGLVSTPSEFGTRSSPPTHPELLDYLAARFMDEGWSVKKLHRSIMLSSTYQQSSENEMRYARRDPDNQLLTQMPQHRLDFEAMRDSLLVVSGQLDPTLGGQPVDIVATNFSGRRTVYGFIDRQELPNLFRMFDFANPDATSPRRYQTTVAQQALYLLNSPFVAERAKNLVGSPAFSNVITEEERLRKLYQTLYQRVPTPGEIKVAKNFLRDQPAHDAVIPELTAWEYGYGVFDENIQRVKTFTPLPRFTGTAWQGGTNLPDPKIGWVQLTAEGGHPAQTNAAIRRWVAPREGVIAIHGTFSHASTNGDGVQGRIISSRIGVLGQWTVHNANAITQIEEVEVKAGDTIDFVTDCLANENADSFKWSSVIEMMKVDANESMGLPRVWDAQQNFVDPKTIPRPLGAWEKYAQVLLLSNEFVFVE